MRLRRERRLSLPLLGAVGLILGLVIAAALAAPRVHSVSPQHNSSQVPASAPISITFTQPMDADSVMEHISVSPPLDLTPAWSDETLTLFHDDPWPRGETVTVTLASGARSQGFLSTLTSRTWSFIVGEPRIAFLYPAGQPAQIYAQSPNDEAAQPLTETALGVYDFSLNHQGTLIAYSEERSDGGTDLRLLDLVTGEDSLAYNSPPGTRCEAVVISPDADYLAFECFEFRPSASGQLVPGPRRVWLLSLAQDQQPILASQEDHITTAPSFSPSGMLAYYDSASIAIMIVEPGPGGSGSPAFLLGSAMGNISSWSPDGDFLAFAEMVFPLPRAPAAEDTDELDLDFYTHLYLADLASAELLNLSGEEREPVEDASPAFSPNGQIIAFARRFMDQERFTLGRQIWVMNPDGSNARPLTSETMMNHSALAWSPDSSSLAYMRFDLLDISQPAEIWLMGADGENQRMLVRGGYLPVWLP